MAAPPVLLVEDDPLFGTSLLEQLGKTLPDETKLVLCQDATSAIEAADRLSPRLVVLDLSIPRTRGARPHPTEGDRLIAHLNRAHPLARLVVLSGQDRDAAVHLLLGRRIDDYLFKDSRWPEILMRLGRHVEEVSESIDAKTEGEGAFVGESTPIRQVMGWIARVAPEDTSVHLFGESGTGKEVVARRIHALSRRAARPFVAVHCGAIPETLIESELFGHVAGAFSGATGSRKGRFQMAHQGTIFLDEVGEVPAAIQAKLLRVLESHDVEPLGADRPVPVDIRLVTATHRDLGAEVRAGRFREDLYHRLVVFTIELPALRNHREDIPKLCRHILDQLGRRMAKRCTGIDEDAVKYLQAQAWPGNVRELRNAIEGACIRAEGTTLRRSDFSSGQDAGSPSTGTGRFEGPDLLVPGFSLEEYLTKIERQCIEDALGRCGGNGAQAGRLLGMKEHTFRAKARRHGIW